ncbi:MAG: YHS domain-containing (seleno)protein [Pseudomonadota bacterium]
MNRRTLLIGGAAVLTATAATASLLLPRRLAPALTYQKDGLALGGTDPVAYFTHARPIAGDPSVTHDWAGARWAFVDEMHRDAFAADPAAYAPQYGGFCAWAVAAKGELFSTQPENWAIVDDKLYLNFNDDVQAMWDEDRAGFIAQGDMRWPEIVAEV